MTLDDKFRKGDRTALIANGSDCFGFGTDIRRSPTSFGDTATRQLLQFEEQQRRQGRTFALSLLFLKFGAHPCGIREVKRRSESALS